MSSSPFTSLKRHCCFTTVQLAERNLRRAKELISTGEREDFKGSLHHLNTALELHPNFEKAFELKARVLLYLKRYKEVVELLHEFLPSAKLAEEHVNLPSRGPKLAQETRTRKQVLLTKLHRKVSSGLMLSMWEKVQNFHSEDSPERWGQISISKLRQKLSPRSQRVDPKDGLGWRYLILGQACCHLGMMEDAMLLLQSGKRTASAASRRYSNGMRDDNFCSENSFETMHAGESDLVNHMLANIKLLLRRRAAAEAALEAGLYAESVRHFTKILDNQRNTPPGFVEDCYLHRAIAFQATGRVVDAIADCNRTLSLNPRCTKALSVRASLHEMVKSFSECLLDLQQLKMIYEALLRRQLASVDWSASQWSSGQDYSSTVTIRGSLDYINSKIVATRRRLCSRTCSLAARTILDLPQHCSMEDVEKAYLLLSLKHSPDKAAPFVEHCPYQDRNRDLETVKEEARASALRLSHLIHRAYTKLLSAISEEEAEEQYERRACEASFRKRCAARKPSYICVAPSEVDYFQSPSLVDLSHSDEFADSEASFVESEGFSDDGVSVYNGVVNYNYSAEVSDVTVSLDVEGIIDAGVAKVGFNDEVRGTEALARMHVNYEHVVSEQALGALDDETSSDTLVEQRQVVIKGCSEAEMCSKGDDDMVMRGCSEAAVCSKEGDKNEVMKVVLKALTSFKKSDSLDGKLITTAVDNAELDQHSNDELHHPVKSCHGGLCNEALANAISQACFMDNPNLLPHQRWLMNVSDNFSWNLPLSQPLSVT
ncbi:hypothetical protein L7F22_018333 [Adiantum nelumboides]|nr:hypothetical protein [Adiantum nelumboides]